MPQPMDRLPQINYSLLKDNALRKKLSELGIPSNGTRALLMRRHTEWVNLVNANCDSNSPRSKRDLLRELDLWDKTQGRQLSAGNPTSTTTVMHKDFDGAAWAQNHNDNFKKLIAEARRKTAMQTSSDEDVQPARSLDVRDPPIVLARTKSPPNEVDASVNNGHSEIRHPQHNSHKLKNLVDDQV